MNMEMVIKGIKVLLVETEECDNDYQEYDIFNGDTIIGNVAKYNSQEEYTGWNIDGRPVGTRYTLKGIVTAVVTEYQRVRA